MLEIKQASISPSALASTLGTGTALELLDVRTPPEYAAAHVPGAQLRPLAELDIAALLAPHKPGTPIYVLCQSGARAAQAIERLQRAGCPDGILVDGGTQAWIDAGLPVHSGQTRVLPLLRQVQLVIGSLAAAGSLLALTISAWFAILPLFLGCGLIIAGATGTCGMASLLARMPWNRGHSHCSRCCTQE